MAGTVSGTIDEIVGSPDPIVRAIGMLDGRVGKRRLAGMKVEGENPLVRRLYEFRCEAEGIEVM